MELYERIRISDDESIEVEPGELVLGLTEEFLQLSSNVCCQVTGRSSYSRLGIEVQCTQDHIAPGYTQNVPLQIKNNSPFSIKLYPKIRICQLIFLKLTKDTKLPYTEKDGAKYLHESDIRGSRFYADEEVRRIRQLKREEAQEESGEWGKLIRDFVLLLFGASLSIGSRILTLEFDILILGRVVSITATLMIINSNR